MRIRWFCLAVAVWLLTASGLLAQQICRGIVHLHSVYSDGDRTPGMLKNAVKTNGLSYVVVTDHLDQIDQNSARKKLMGSFYGFDRYLGDFNSNEAPIIFGGTEISLGSSHLLAFGSREKMKTFFESAVPTDGTPNATISHAKNMGLLTVAAHPYFSKYLFNTAEGDQVSGIEFFNENYESYLKTRAWYLKLIQQGKDVFVTAGCDSHMSVDILTFDLKRWSRRTNLKVAGDLNQANILESFRQGRTYASCDGAYLDGEADVLTGFQAGDFDPQNQLGVYCFYLRFNKETGDPHIARMYMDGAKIEGSDQRIPKGVKAFDYRFEWGSVPAGLHTFVFEVEGLLITSPIRWRLPEKPQPAPAEAEPILPVVKTIPPTGTPVYFDTTDALIKITLKLKWINNPSIKLIINDTDRQRVANYQADRRVVATINELVDRGHRLAVRIASGYNDQAHMISRETELQPGQLVIISAHNTAQAFDIFMADGVTIGTQAEGDFAQRKQVGEKIQELLSELLAIGQQDPNLLPTQFFVWREEDITPFLADLDRLYGPLALRGNSGLWAGPRYWDRIHVGY